MITLETLRREKKAEILRLLKELLDTDVDLVETSRIHPEALPL